MLLCVCIYSVLNFYVYFPFVCLLLLFVCCCFCIQDKINKIMNSLIWWSNGSKGKDSINHYSVVCCCCCCCYYSDCFLLVVALNYMNVYYSYNKNIWWNQNFPNIIIIIIIYEIRIWNSRKKEKKISYGQKGNLFFQTKM